MTTIELPYLVRQSLPSTPLEQGLLGSAVITSIFYSSYAGAAFGLSYIAYKTYKTSIIASPISANAPLLEPPPLAIRSSQSEQPFETNFLSSPTLTLTETKKLEKLAKERDCIAIARVQNVETSQWEFAYIKKTPDGYPGRDHFGIYTFDDHCLGAARVDPLPLSDPKTLDRWDRGIPRRLRGYGPQKQPELVDKIEIYSLYTKENSIQKKYKYTGYALLKAIEAEYRDCYEGRTILDSKPGAIGFYYKLGFRSPDESINQKISQIIENAKIFGTLPQTEPLGKIPMFLPDQARAEWQNRPPLPKPADVLLR